MPSPAPHRPGRPPSSGAARTGWLALALVTALAAGATPAQQRKEYLTSLEADKIRDAETPGERLKLYLGFAADRLKKFHYELTRPQPDRHRSERLNALLEAYTGCLEDASDVIEAGRVKQEDIRAGIKEIQGKGKEFLADLERVLASGADVAAYRENLQDAIVTTKDALQGAEKASKEIAPPPVRRRP